MTLHTTWECPKPSTLPVPRARSLHSRAPPLTCPDSPLHADPELKKIAEKYNVQLATVLLSWLANKGIVVLPKSVTPSRECSSISCSRHTLHTYTQASRVHRIPCGVPRPSFAI